MSAIEPPGPHESVDDGARPLRRAPFSPNPTVGTRGLRTQQRILDAALQVFGEHGYERTTIDKIARAAGCSRVSVYQYFEDKHDVFRHLAGQVARQRRATTEALPPLRPDHEGWLALRTWVGRFGDIFARYEPIFRAFGAASETDATLAGLSERVEQRNIAVLESKLTSTTLPPRHLAPVVTLVSIGVTRALDRASILRTAEPEAWQRERFEDALTDVVHRCFFGLRADVNAHVRSDGRAPVIPIGSALIEVIARVDALGREADQPDRRALASLLEVGHKVVVGRGYRGTRVDDLVAAAGVSHGAFYRYFENKDDFVRVVAVRALDTLSRALRELPDGADRAELRRWLRRYAAAQAEHAAMIGVWVSASDELLQDELPAVFDWGRRQLAHLLRGRAFGDEAADALVLLAFIEAYGLIPANGGGVDAAVHAIEEGFLGMRR